MEPRGLHRRIRQAIALDVAASLACGKIMTSLAAVVVTIRERCERMEVEFPCDEVTPMSGHADAGSSHDINEILHLLKGMIDLGFAEQAAVFSKSALSECIANRHSLEHESIRARLATVIDDYSNRKQLAATLMSIRSVLADIEQHIANSDACL